MKKYKILILSNPDNEEIEEDYYIINSFKADGNEVDCKWVDYDEDLDNYYDIIIRRNTWIEEENDKAKKYYTIKDNELVNRLKNKKIKCVNLEGLDGKGKTYLCELYSKGMRVIPSIKSLDEIDKLENANEFVLKEIDSFGSGIGQKILKLEDLNKYFKQGYLIQPKLEFKSEVQCYFVGQELLYVYEYSPSKYPNYPKPKLIELNEEDKKLANEFARISGVKVGFQRIDFLKLKNDELILLEIEDNSPLMDICKLPEEIREKVITKYKENIYEYLKK